MPNLTSGVHVLVVTQGGSKTARLVRPYPYRQAYPANGPVPESLLGVDGTLFQFRVSDGLCVQNTSGFHAELIQLEGPILCNHDENSIEYDDKFNVINR